MLRLVLLVLLVLKVVLLVLVLLVLQVVEPLVVEVEVEVEVEVKVVEALGTSRYLSSKSCSFLLVQRKCLWSLPGVECVQCAMYKLYNMCNVQTLQCAMCKLYNVQCANSTLGRPICLIAPNGLSGIFAVHAVAHNNTI